MTYLRPDSKSQVTLQYQEDGTPERIHTIVVSTQHDDFDQDEVMLKKSKTTYSTFLYHELKQNYHKELKVFLKAISFYM